MTKLTIVPDARTAFSRLAVLASLECATGEGLDCNDPLPDTLIAHAQALGLTPLDLRLFIFDDPKRPEWTREALTRWAREFRPGKVGA